jgi:hypothetical protein
MLGQVHLVFLELRVPPRFLRKWPRTSEAVTRCHLRVARWLIIASVGGIARQQWSRTFPRRVIFGRVSSHLPWETLRFTTSAAPPPSIVFGKVPSWHLVTASLPLGPRRNNGPVIGAAPAIPIRSLKRRGVAVTARPWFVSTSGGPGLATDAAARSDNGDYAGPGAHWAVPEVAGRRRRPGAGAPPG